MRANFDSVLVSRANNSVSPWVAGISGGPDGCYSVALSGGYEDDVDLGEGLYVALGMNVIINTYLCAPI